MDEKAINSLEGGGALYATFQLIQQFEMPELGFKKWLGIAIQLKQVLTAIQKHSPSEASVELKNYKTVVLS